MVPSADCIVQMQCILVLSPSYLSRIAHSRRTNQSSAILILLTLCGPIFRSQPDISQKRLRSKRIAPSALFFGNSCTPAVDPIRTRHNAAHQGLKLEVMSADDGRAPPHKKREIAEAGFLAEGECDVSLMISSEPLRMQPRIVKLNPQFPPTTSTVGEAETRRIDQD